MSTLDQLLAQVRLELGDTEVLNQRWSDLALEHHLRHALAMLSQAAPRQLKTNVTAPGGTRDLDLSSLAGRLGVEAVEYPTGQYPPCYAPFSLWGDTLTLLVDTPPEAGAAATVYWTAHHQVDGAGSTLAAPAEHLLVVGAAAFAALEQAAVATNQVNAGGDGTADRYLAWGQERLAEFEQGLAERRRKQGLLPRRLYAPAGDPPSGRARVEV